MNVYNVTDYCRSITLSLSGQTSHMPNEMHEIRLNVELDLVVHIICLEAKWKLMRKCSNHYPAMSHDDKMIKGIK